MRITSENYKNFLNYIYSLEDSNGVFYIGRTIDIKTRMRTHKTHFGEFEYKILHECSGKLADKLERKTIKEYKEKGVLLTNRLIYDNDKNYSFNYKFKTESDYVFYKIIAIKNNTSVQALITEALKSKHPKTKPNEPANQKQNTKRQSKNDAAHKACQ